MSQLSAVAACGKAHQTDVIVDRNIICTGSGSPPKPYGTSGATRNGDPWLAPGFTTNKVASPRRGSCIPQIVCPRSPLACISPILTNALLGSRNEADDSFRSHFAPDLSITEAQGLLRSFVQRSSHVPPSLHCHRAETRSAWEVVFPLFSTDYSAISDAEPLLMPKFQPDCRVFVVKLISIQLRFTRRCFLHFPADILASHLTSLSTPGHPCWTGASQIAVLMPSWR